MRQIPPQPGRAFEHGAVEDLGPGLDDPSAEIPLTESAHRIERFQREPVGIDPTVAARALWIRTVFLGELPHGELFERFVLRQTRHILRRLGQFLAKDHLANPITPENGAGARGTRLTRQGGRLSENATARDRAQPRHPFPFVGSSEAHRRHSIEACQIGVQEGVVGVEDVEHRAIVLEEVGEETNRLFAHGAAQSAELGKMPLALLVQRLEVVQMQPSQGKLGGQAADLGILEHPPGLGTQDFRPMKTPCHGFNHQLGVGR